jgi:uncharacterized protein (DUF1330 family)
MSTSTNDKPVYYIGAYDIVNMEEFMKYPPRVMAILPRYGGEILASDVEATTLEGSARTMNAIIRFPSQQAALNCYNDPEYQREVKPIRQNATRNSTMVLVKQFEK